MVANRTRLAVLIGAFLLSVSVGCGGKQGSPLVSSVNGNNQNIDDAMVEAITTLTANSIASEVLALSEVDPPPPTDSAPSGEHPRLDKLKEMLGLTDDQVTQIQQIIESTRQAIQAIRQQVHDGTLTRQQAHEQIRQQREQQRDQISAVLTPEQQVRFAELRAERDRQFNIRRLQQALGLTDEQAAQVEQIMRNTWTQIQDFKRQVEAGTLTPEEAREQIRVLHQAEQTQIESVLTPEQGDRFAAIMRHHNRQHRRGGG